MFRLLLLGSAFGALLHQRGLLVLHGSAITTASGAVVFTGASGFGKSALAAAFYQRGYRVLTDEICAISTGGPPEVLPATPFLMVWSDTANVLGISTENLRRVRSGLQKFILPLGDGFTRKSTPIHRIYVLAPSNSGPFSIVPLRGAQKIKALSLAGYRPHFIEGMGLNAQYFKQIRELAVQTRIAMVNQPVNTIGLDRMTELLTADFSV